MNKKTLLILGVILTTNYLIAQSVEFGPMINYEQTTFTVPTGNIVIGGPGGGGEETRNTGHETNIAFGGYFMLYPDGVFSDRFGYGAELYYLNNTSTEIKDFSASTINFIPYLNFSPFTDFPFFVGFGGGVSYIISSNNNIETLSDNDINNFGLQVKFAASYRIENIATIEVGAHGGFLDIVDDQLKTNSYYFGIKVPLNQLLNR